MSLNKYFQICYDVMNANNTKTNNGLIYITMQGKVKDAKMLKMPPLFLKQQIFVFENEDSACPQGREVTLIR